MSEVDPRIVAALRGRLAGRPGGAARVGWKVGSGDGEPLALGDRIITGLVVQVAVGPGDEVAADFGALGRAALRIA